MEQDFTEIQELVALKRFEGPGEDYFEEFLEENPIMATMIGDPRYNDRLPNFLTPEYIAEQQAFEEGIEAAQEMISIILSRFSFPLHFPVLTILSNRHSELLTLCPAAIPPPVP